MTKPKLHTLKIAISILALTCGSGQANESFSSDNYQAIVSRIELSETHLQTLRSEIDRTQFDLGVLLDDLEYDPKLIIDYVSHNIEFEPYAGLLRGAGGTLMSGAGHSPFHDQACASTGRPRSSWSLNR